MAGLVVEINGRMCACGGSPLISHLIPRASFLRDPTRHVSLVGPPIPDPRPLFCFSLSFPWRRRQRKEWQNQKESSTICSHPVSNASIASIVATGLDDRTGEHNVDNAPPPLPFPRFSSPRTWHRHTHTHSLSLSHARVKTIRSVYTGPSPQHTGPAHGPQSTVHGPASHESPLSA